MCVAAWINSLKCCLCQRELDETKLICLWTQWEVTWPAEHATGSAESTVRVPGDTNRRPSRARAIIIHTGETLLCGQRSVFHVSPAVNVYTPRACFDDGRDECLRWCFRVMQWQKRHFFVRLPCPVRAASAARVYSRNEVLQDAVMDPYVRLYGEISESRCCQV